MSIFESDFNIWANISPLEALRGQRRALQQWIVESKKERDAAIKKLQDRVAARSADVESAEKHLQEIEAAITKLEA